ncbi:hypothetical protein ANACOL_04242 [Anaerotruncus colihominis DSM 17241]|uniref:Uncharacterized protein n=1 Tax=Anaerotruncus colihominis DSM 17241 TaxID=445972 RepID=B0PHE9_9FIRM|nr:hypothetical protein ANACOL_04242 [Anaerotruncus colihominis DSM 17241]
MFFIYIIEKYYIECKRIILCEKIYHNLEKMSMETPKNFSGLMHYFLSAEL